MTIYARKVLEDCKGALNDLKDGIQGEEWRRRWITAVVLLRVVGHVLNKVDKKTNPKLARAIDTVWQALQHSKPEPRIFWEFIEQERNNILKEYAINAGQGVTIRVGSPTPFEYHYKILSGPFAGRDQREVVGEAIQWWEATLDRVDELAK